MRPSFDFSVSSVVRSLFLAAALAAAGCNGSSGGGDPGDSVDPADPDAVTEVVSVALGGALTNKITGAPPAPSGAAATDAPVISADVTSTAVEAGDDVDVPLTVRSVNDIDALFAKIPGAESYFEITVPETGKRSRIAMAKATRTFALSITVPGNVAPGQFCIEISARDTSGLVSNLARVCLNVVDDPEPAGNQPPVARISADQTVLPGAAVTLDGSASSDADGGIVGYVWTQVQGPPVALTTPTVTTAAFTAPNTETALAFVLTVTDDEGAAGSDSVAITVSNTPPPTTISFESAAQTAVESAGTVRVGLSVVPVPTETITLPFTVSGTASAPDRTVVASPLVIAAGATNVFIDVSVTDDSGAESDETVILTLGTPSSGELGQTTTFTLTIDDNEGTAPAQGTLFVIDEAYRLVRFQASAPGTILSTVEITGVAPNQDGSPPLVTSMDFRPSTGELYLYVDNRRVYRINTTSGAATLVTTTSAAQVDTVDLNGFDFNPCNDQLRATGNGLQNFRFNGNAGFLARDADLAYANGDVNEGGEASIDAIAYTACVGGATTLFGVDGFNNTLVRIGSVGGSPSSPNAGQMTTIGSFASGVGGASQGGFDIDLQGGSAYLTDGDGTQTTLYRIDLTTGAQTNLGIIGDGVDAFRSNCLAIQP
jgi:hypothetical protein